MTSATSTHYSPKEAVMLNVQIANFPINAQGFWGKVEGVIAVSAELVREYPKGAEVRLVNPPMPYDNGEVLYLDRLADGSYGPAELVGAA
jgi:hypothetical protein